MYEKVQEMTRGKGNQAGMGVRTREGTMAIESEDVLLRCQEKC